MVRDTALRNLTAGLSAAPIDVAVRFQPIRMRTDDIVDLRPGDVVPLGHPTSVPLEVTVNETVFAHAVPGNQGARLACLVVPLAQGGKAPMTAPTITEPQLALARTAAAGGPGRAADQPGAARSARPCRRPPTC